MKQPKPISLNKPYAETGNLTIDSVINYKLRSCKAQQIHVTADLQVPSDLSIASVDLSAVLGCLLDNALEALVKTDQRELHLSLSYRSGILTIFIENTFNGQYISHGGQYLTTKTDAAVHGYGLKSVRRITEKYHGTMEISLDSQWFKVQVLLFEPRH
jgi:sensor histidine kinase regulating citrate/malate metabolism